MLLNCTTTITLISKPLNRPVNKLLGCDKVDGFDCEVVASLYLSSRTIVEPIALFLNQLLVYNSYNQLHLHTLSIRRMHGWYVDISLAMCKLSTKRSLVPADINLHRRNPTIGRSQLCMYTIHHFSLQDIGIRTLV